MRGDHHLGLGNEGGKQVCSHDSYLRPQERLYEDFRHRLFPDLAGEVFDQQVVERKRRPDRGADVEMIQMSNIAKTFCPSESLPLPNLCRLEAR